MMILLRFKISCIILILFTSGCTDDIVLELPVRTHLDMRFLPLDLGIYSQPEEIEYRASTGQIGIQRIAFEGMREFNDDIYFETDPAIDLPISEFIDQSVVVSEFYLPQEIYNYIRLDIDLNAISTEEWISEVDTASAEIGLIIKGSYTHISFNTDLFPILKIQFVLLIDRTEKFIFRSAGDVVIKQPDCQILIVFDLNKAFQSIDYNMFEQAEMTGGGDVKHMIISSTNNRDLYEHIIYQLGMSTRMIVH